MAQKLTNFDMVIFGATGDLAMRKLLPCLYQAHAAGLLNAEGRILGVSRSDLDTEGFLKKVESDAKIHVKEHFSEAAWDAFVKRIQYLKVDVTQKADFDELAECVKARENTENVIIYLSYMSNGACNKPPSAGAEIASWCNFPCRRPSEATPKWQSREGSALLR